MLLPALTYGGELARLTAQQEQQMEAVQDGTAAQLLDVSQQWEPHAALRGMLAWWTVRARCHAARLRDAQRVMTAVRAVVAAAGGRRQWQRRAGEQAQAQAQAARAVRDTAARAHHLCTTQQT